MVSREEFVEGISAGRQNLRGVGQIEHGTFARQKFSELVTGFQLIRVPLGMTPNYQTAAARPWNAQETGCTKIGSAFVVDCSDEGTRIGNHCSCFPID